MKLKIKDIEPNPYRNLKKFPIDEGRVEELKASIKRTKFWGGLVCREHPTKKGKYQLAFGHHRLQAITNLGAKEISIKVLQYTDAQMLQAMADENRNTSDNQVDMILNVVEQVKKYLDKEFDKYETIKELPKSLINLLETSTQSALSGAKKKDKNGNLIGAGQTIILKFLGDDWNQPDIQFALIAIDDINKGVLDRTALAILPNKYQASQFRQAVKEAEIPKRKQKEIAEAITSGKIGGRDIKEKVYEFSKKELPMLDDFVKKLMPKIHEVEMDFKKLKGSCANIQDKDLTETLTDDTEDMMQAVTIIIKELKSE